MNKVGDKINKDMCELDLIDVESLDFSDEQTWLHKLPEDSGQRVNMVDWYLSLDWPEDEDYQKTEKELFEILDEILKNQILAMPDKHKFDSRTYVRPKKRTQRPSIHNIVEVNSNPSSMTSQDAMNAGNKYLTYNKYNLPRAQMLRLKTFSVEADTDNSNKAKEYAMKRRSLVQDEDPQLEDASERLSPERLPNKSINIDLSQPAHNLYNTFNKGMMVSDRSSWNMYQSKESLGRMSPPPLVSSLMMDSSGNFNLEPSDGRKSFLPQRDSGVLSGRQSVDPVNDIASSLASSIIDIKDMNTSFLSQTTYADQDSVYDSLPPSLVNSNNSSFHITTIKPRVDSMESSNNIFSSATFTHLEQSEKLLSARPRHQPYNNVNKRDTTMRSSESYTKTREEACQIDNTKVLNENQDKDYSNVIKPTEMSETVTLHYSNNKFRRNNDAEKENLNSSFEIDDTFYKDMNMAKEEEVRNSLNVTMNRQELEEIIQARQKLSLARKALPTEVDKLPNQVETSPVKTSQAPNQTLTTPKRNMDNSPELLSRRRYNGCEKEDPIREPPKRNATFKKNSPRANSLDTTVVFVKQDNNDIIDINSATLNLLEDNENNKTLQQVLQESQERAMVGSSESTDTATFSSSSPPESVPDVVPLGLKLHVASTPLTVRKSEKYDKFTLDLHSSVSPIYNMVDDKSYTVNATPVSNASANRTSNINSATMVKKSPPKRDILSGHTSPEKKMLGAAQARSLSKVPTSASYSVMPPPPTVNVPRKTGLPTSKLRQYSSHKELRIPIGSNNVVGVVGRSSASRGMCRTGVYASNPALSPTQPRPPVSLPMPTGTGAVILPARRDSYTIQTAPHHHPHHKQENGETTSRPVLTNPPALVRQGTETLRRERPQSQLVQPKDLRGTSVASSVPVSMRNHLQAPTARPYSIAGSTQLKVNRPTSVPAHKMQVASSAEQRPASNTESRVSALPRPSRLPAPKRTLRPPSVYSVAPTADVDQY